MMESDKDTENATQAGEQPVDGETEVTVEPSEAAADDEADTTESGEVEKLALRCRQLEEQALRLRAEMDNLRKRNAREMDNARRFALERFMGDLLDVRDSLERGLQAAEADTVSLEQLREGKQLTLRQLRGVMEKHGLEELDPTGQPFDPEQHEAISMVAIEGTEPGTVFEVVQKGYRLNDRLLRPARVVVAQ